MQKCKQNSATWTWHMHIALVHCNAPFAGFSKLSVGWLHLVENAAARVLTDFNILPSYWSHFTGSQFNIELPVQVLLQAYKALSSLPSQFISDFLSIYNLIRSFNYSQNYIQVCWGCFSYCGNWTLEQAACWLEVIYNCLHFTKQA